MQEKWRPLAAFPEYSVSNFGNVKSNKTGRLLVQTLNQQGFRKVKLMRNGQALTRQVNQLVAEAFLPPPPRRDFISVIHLNGDKADCHADNLATRPRYFAVKYHQQFDTPIFQEMHYPVIDLKTGRQYGTAQEAALEHGLIFSEIVMATQNRSFVWPTYQEFRTLVD